MPRYICVYGYRRLYAHHSVQNTVDAMIQVHIRLEFCFGRQMESCFDVQRLVNGTCILTMVTVEGLPGGLILRPLVDGELRNNYDVGFRLVSDDYGRQDMGLRGVNENNVNDGANSANENNNDDNDNNDNNHNEHNDKNNEGNNDDDGGNENEQNSNDDGGTNGDGVANSAYKNNDDDNDNDDNNHDEHNDKNNEGNDDNGGEHENEQNSNDDVGTNGDGVIDLNYSTDDMDPQISP